MKRRYPLEVLSRIRAHDTSQRARETADLAGARRSAEQKLAEATDRKEAEKGRLGAARAVESKRLGAGIARAADLARAERFRHDAKGRIEKREEAEARATLDAAEVAAKERRAVAALAGAHAAEKAVLEHQARFRAGERRSRDGREDDAVEDALRARRASRGQKVR